MKNKINPTTASFEAIISGGSLYVDKTKYLYELLKQDSSYYFCSRPRRFGKTLTIYTLEAIFKGKRELFKGLYIDKTDYDWKEYPVIHIDFGLADDSTAKGIESWINDKLIAIGKGYGVELKQDNIMKLNFELLIKELSKQAKVVVLIDEYDKPLSSNIYNPEVEGIRDVLRGFFEVLKASPDYIRFVFITGVTKYAKVSIFSSMNNLMDISMTEQYANMFGYTQEELETNFKEYIDDGYKATGMTRNDYLTRIKKKYDGYCFFPNTETVYNPVSIGMFFAQGGKVFDNFWVSTGGNSKLLIDVAKKIHFKIEEGFTEVFDKDLISIFDVVQMANTNVSIDSWKALLLQTGYLTIKRAVDEYSFILDFPNEEVCSGFLSRLTNLYTGSSGEIAYTPARLTLAFGKGDTKYGMSIIKSIYASIPYQINSSADKEADYHRMLQCMIMGAGGDVTSEIPTNKGRIDAVLKANNHIYLFELKINDSAENAIKQIKDKGYYEKYESCKAEGYTVHLVGISISTEERNIKEFVEEIV